MWGEGGEENAGRGALTSLHLPHPTSHPAKAMSPDVVKTSMHTGGREEGRERENQ